jgi:hypothetical protein
MASPVHPGHFPNAAEPSRVAEDLAAKHGRSALLLAAKRARRASQAGDARGYAAWSAVLEAASDLLERAPWCYL